MIGNPDDTPPASRLPPESEEQLVVDAEMGKEGDKNGRKGGRILFFVNARDDKGQPILRTGSGSGKVGMTVEEVVLRERHREGGWAGLHCEYELVLWLMMLLLWEDMFDERVKAASAHCFMVRGAFTRRWE